MMLLTIPKEMKKKELIEVFGNEDLSKKAILTETLDEN